MPGVQRALWTEAERYAANRKSILAHRGQEVTADGKVIGPAPATRTLGFRWTAVDNHFATAADVAADEFNATKERDKENSEKELCQFVHCIPYDPPNVEVTPLEVDVIARRTTPLKRGIVPQDAFGITVGIDTNKRHMHWVAIAWLQTGAGFVIDYGVQPVASDRLGFHAAAIDALKRLKSILTMGGRNKTARQRLHRKFGSIRAGTNIPTPCFNSATSRTWAFRWARNITGQAKATARASGGWRSTRS